MKMKKNGFPNVFPLIPYNLQMCDVRWQRNNNKERNKRKIKQTYKTKKKTLTDVHCRLDPLIGRLLRERKSDNVT